MTNSATRTTNAAMVPPTIAPILTCLCVGGLGNGVAELVCVNKLVCVNSGVCVEGLVCVEKLVWVEELVDVGIELVVVTEDEADEEEIWSVEDVDRLVDAGLVVLEETRLDVVCDVLKVVDRELSDLICDVNDLTVRECEALEPVNPAMSTVHSWRELTVDSGGQKKYMNNPLVETEPTLDIAARMSALRPFSHRRPHLHLDCRIILRRGLCHKFQVAE